MARIVLKNIQSKKRSAGLLNIESIVRGQIDGVLEQTKKEILKSLNDVVADWKSDVKFQARNIVKPNYIAINAYPVGGDKEVWEYVDKGTRPHQIKAKGKGLLRFKTGYQPKTLPNPARYGASGGGISTGDWKAKNIVQHPGSKARKFEKTIAGDYQPKFIRDSNNAFRRAARQINKQ